ncbi:MAG: FMN-binding protein [Mycoplasmatales bacterium]
MNDYIKYPIILFSVTVICTILITITYNYTTPILNARQEMKINDTLSSMYDNIESSEEIERTFDPKKTSVTKVYLTTLPGGLNAYIYSASSIGKNGSVDMLISVLPDGQIDVVKYTRMEETPKIGDKLSEPDYITNLETKSTLNPEIDMVTGATITSNAVKSMIEDVSKDFNENYRGDAKWKI